ncbi:MAG: alpha/beta hydrolase [Candidatus Aminicenantes bacterium]|nr:alpha/beta hydrolase [Candidatus Aminicenantes bacterium]
MKNFRTYGDPPYKVVVLHGGPGAPGQMAPVARELFSRRGVLEPLQTKSNLEGQVQELFLVLEKNCAFPVTLIGSSWGAMLGFIFSAYHPMFVKKLILVGSGVFEKKYAEKIQEKRLNRLNLHDREEIQVLLDRLSIPAERDKNKLFNRLGELMTKADAYNPLTLETEIIKVQYELHQNVWKDVVKIRNNGELLELGKRIECPVVAIHGDYDPHPVEGIKNPLSSVLNNFKFILLKNCGHLPWIEKEAKSEFYAVLEKELPL